jgi:hypothetical protein
VGLDVVGDDDGAELLGAEEGLEEGVSVRGEEEGVKEGDGESVLSTCSTEQSKTRNFVSKDIVFFCLFKKRDQE